MSKIFKNPLFKQKFICYNDAMDKVDFEFRINSKFYNEHYARYLLESFFSDTFKNAEVADKPDIWVEGEGEVKGIGVEVTTLLDTYYNTLKKYRRAWADQELSLEQIAKSVPTLLRNKLGVNSHGNIILIGKNKRNSLPKSLMGIETTIKTKLEKLQFYREFDMTSLFIFATNLNPECTVDRIFETIKKIDKSAYKRLFETIMIFDYENLQIYPLAEEGTPEVYKVTDETKFFCDKLADMEEKRIMKEYNNKKAMKKFYQNGSTKHAEHKNKTFGDEE